MASAVSKITLSSSREIPFNKLVLSRSNVRRVKASVSIQELANARAWQSELAGVPEFADSELHIVTGLLLPIWRQLPDEHCRVYRLQTDDGERVIGRLVLP